MFVSALTISNVSTSPANTVYYGNCAPGDPTQIHVEATVDPLDQIKEVVLWFDISDQFGIAYSDFVNMWQLGVGDYAGDIDIGQIGPTTLVDIDGSIAFWIEAVDKDSTSIWSNTYSLSIWNCLGGVIGQPPAPPPTINFFTVSNPVQAGDWVNLDWETFDASCGVTLDGNPVSTSGNTSYQTSAGNAGQTFTHTLIASGEPCNNPTDVSATVQVTVNSAPTTIAKGSGSLYDEQSLDVGDGFENDIIFDIEPGSTVLIGNGSTALAVWYGGPPSVNDCMSYIDSGAYGQVTIAIDDVVCYGTGSGNYGYLTIDGMFIDLDNESNSYVSISYQTEINP